jgi:hypothetical protein
MRRNKFSFRLSEKEVKKLKYLTKLFYLLGCISKQSMSDAIRYMVNFEMKNIKEEEMKKLQDYYDNFLNNF